MNVWTTRSGLTLHATSSCPELDGRRVLKLDRADVLPKSLDCMERLCVMVRARQERSAA